MASYFEKLQALQAHAHAPYSHFQVAAILVLKDGTEVRGVNVENASFGGTICAERSAFVSAVSQTGKVDQFAAIHLLAGKGEQFVMPCGMCRQVMSEFVGSDFPVYLYNTQGASRTVTMGELLPFAFSQADL
ncbi:cytidine deaminase [Simiduia sp. 21SJ11W-1]|uniref:cytidine deaminase n=1 Tax=Simiduia sp. 21SJ11W-1 TaxID=2909669 RepID=UPI00209E9940|nr:cytidine deaminase [Simiduia sp. 21SJ11W-1]UTA47580.1 cytidine deaminase [Simiduia sp. 21SJ11W-1]